MFERVKRTTAVSLVFLIGAGIATPATRKATAADTVLAEYSPSSKLRLPERLRPTPDITVRAATSPAHRPLQFEPNLGQSHDSIKFVSRLPAYRLSVTPTETVLDFRKFDFDAKKYLEQPKWKMVRARQAVEKAQRVTGGVVRMRLLGARADAPIVGEERLPGIVNHIRGNNPSKWRMNVPTFAKVRHKDVYPGIDFVYYGTPAKLEYDVVVSPGADPSVVAIAMDGVDRLEV